jgi:diguanylate cyclase (GGDEF)-like protein/PAS domain S-box-containing protein
MAENMTNLLVASSVATTAAIKLALKNYSVNLVVHRVDTKQDLHQALESRDWHLVFSDLALSDFSAVELTKLLFETKPDVPVILIKETGAEEIAVRCLESGVNFFIKCNEHYLRRLPALLDAILRRAEEEQARRLVERKLLESEERYLDIFDNTSDLIQCIAPDGSFLYTNKTWRETLGYSEQEVQSLNLLDVLHPDSMVCCQDRFARLLGGESLACIEFKFLTKSGDTVHLFGDCGSIIKDGDAISTRGIFKNKTDVVKAAEALQASEARYQALYENAPDIYTSISLAGEILSINRMGASMLGYEVSELIGESAAKVIHPEDQRAVFDYVEKYFTRPAPDNGIEYRKIRKDGSVFWVHQQVSLEPGISEPRLLVVCRDVTERRILEDQLAHQASHDNLTNLINRREFERRLQRVLSSAVDPTDSDVLCYLDLDQFKIINDTCGHIAGDELLRQIAALLEGQMRSRDTLARLGGDEFAVLMEHCPLDNAMRFAEKIREAIEGFRFHWRSQSFSLGVSIGVVPIRGGHSIADTLNLADSACYIAKKAGRNRVHVHHD